MKVPCFWQLASTEGPGQLPNSALGVAINYGEVGGGGSGGYRISERGGSG